MKIGIASDHAGYELKSFLKEKLKKEGYELVDFGPDIKRSVDYPDYAEKLSHAIQEKKILKGILICGTGLGMSIAANKFKGVRAALCPTIEYAQLAREHNNANVLALGARFVTKELAQDISKTFLETPFLRGRHLRRVNKIKALIK